MEKLRILMTGGGSGGHIYPLLAVADELAVDETEIIYFGPRSELNNAFRAKGIRVFEILGGKWRRYFSFYNFGDAFKIFLGFFQAFFVLFRLMPDVVFSKGGPGVLPVVLAARFYFIPVMIHESDAVPGLTNRLTAPLAQRVAVSFEKSFGYFPARKTALTGHPIRSSFLGRDPVDEETAKKIWGFNPKKALVLFWGGSQGAETINDFVIGNLASFLGHFQILHQTGKGNFEDVSLSASQILGRIKEDERRRYRAVAYFDDDLRDALTAADLVIGRAGAGSIFETAFFGKPAVLVPLKGAAQDHQRANAYAAEAAGAAAVIEEDNLSYAIVLDQIKKILEDASLWRQMSDAARAFARPQAARLIAEELTKLGKNG